ncbi:MAG: VPDSG-CTERM sorting domain-containing protein [Limisphaerales bacterium]
MKTLVKQVALGSVGLCILAAVSAGAGTLTIGDTVTVNETGVSPQGVVQINDAATGGTWEGVYAGVYQLQIIDGGSTYNNVSSFCIDPFDWSGSSGSYKVGLLSGVSSLTDPHGMTSAAATIVNQLLNYYGSRATPGSQAAVDLQVAIWDAIGNNAPQAEGWAGLVRNSSGGTYVFSSVSPTETFAEYEGAATASGPSGDYLVVTDDHQNYVLVPDGGSTMVLLGMALTGLGVLRRKA